MANNCVFIYYYDYFLFVFPFVLLWRLLTINERAAANKKLCESQNRHTARYALHEGTEKADEEGDGDGDADRGSDGKSSSISSTQAKPNGVHTNPRAVCESMWVWNDVRVRVYVYEGLLGAYKNNNKYSCVLYVARDATTTRHTHTQTVGHNLLDVCSIQK